MKMDEIFHRKDEVRPGRTGLSETGKDLAELKAAIESNQVPEIINAGGTTQGWSWGDLEKLGWAERGQRVISSMQALVEVWWTYTGPNSIKVVTHGANKPEILSTGDSTTPVEVDYS
jgi:hypothetical protein